MPSLACLLGRLAHSAQFLHDLTLSCISTRCGHKVETQFALNAFSTFEVHNYILRVFNVQRSPFLLSMFVQSGWV